MSNYQPFWFDQAMVGESMAEHVPSAQVLTQKLRTQVCILGGGYTGLWSAIKIKQKSPSTDVVILEKDHCGQGASGRNGGCMLTFSTKFNTLAKYFGVQEASRLVTASEQAVLNIDEFCKQHKIDAEIRVDGAMYTATNNSQLTTLRQPIESLQQYDINHWQLKTQEQVQQQTGSQRNLAGIYSAKAGTLQPAKLVRGLRNVALNLGVKIFEHSPMTSIDYGSQVKVTTPKGQVHCDKLILAMNGWMPSNFNYFNNSVVLVSSDMIITEPMPEQLQRIGFDNGMAIADSRIFVHYYRTTPDGRLMLGKGGNLFAYNNQMLSAFDKSSEYQRMLKNAYQWFFPTLPKDFARTWTGASDRSTTGLPFFGALPQQPNVFYGFGYSGNGVVQTYLGGEFLSSLALGLNNEWTRSGMAKGMLGQFPPEPIRSIGANLVKRAVLRKERKEDMGTLPHWIDNQLSKFAASAGKADKH